jgi:hypothetical protein
MIFKSLDFHLKSQYGDEPIALLRPFRLRINYIVDSFSMRIPKKTATLSFHKLNVCVRYERGQIDPFFALEGIGHVELVDPNIASLYQASAPEAAKRVKGFLNEGLRIAAESDALFAGHQDLWNELLSTVDEEFDFDLGMSRSHRSRRWACEAVMRITPTAYHYDVLIKDGKSRQTIQRHRIKTTTPAFPFYRGVGFSKIRWDGNDVVVSSKDDEEIFRFEADLPP